MASKFYGTGKGGQMPSDVTIGDSTGSLAVEVQVDLTKVDNTKQVIMALEAIKNAIIRDTSLPS